MIGAPPVATLLMAALIILQEPQNIMQPGGLHSQAGAFSQGQVGY